MIPPSAFIKPNCWADSDWVYRKNLQTPYDLYDMAEDAYQLLKILGIKNAVIGQSMGGMIAQIAGGALSPPK